MSTIMNLQNIDMQDQSKEKKYKMIAENVSVYYGEIQAVKNITMRFKERTVTSLIGPSGCGKTTFLRCLNRMHDMTKNARVQGKIRSEEHTSELQSH